MDMLSRYNWPGNVRELKNLIHRCIVMVDSEILLPQHFENMLNVNVIKKKDALSVGQTIEDVEMVLIYKTLENTDGNKTRAAEILDITPRTLRNKLNKYKNLQPNFESSINIGNESGVVQESFSS